MAKLLVIGTIHESGLALARRRPDIELDILDDEFSTRIPAAVAGTDAVIVRIARLDAATLAAAERLQVVSKHGVGYDNIDVAALTRRGIPLAVTADANAVSVAEHTLYLMLAAARRGRDYDRAVRTGDFAFRNSLLAVDLWRKRLLLLGFGRIGSRVARRCLAFEMRVSVYDPFVDQAVITAAGCQPVADLDAALGEADVLSVHIPGGGDNVNFINRQRLARLQPGALLINTARGDVIDSAALRRRLQAGALAAAGLDVFASEPPAIDDPLLQRDNVVLSPHSAGTSREAAERVAVAAVENALAVVDGTPDPAMLVNPQVLHNH